MSEQNLITKCVNNINAINVDIQSMTDDTSGKLFTVSGTDSTAISAAVNGQPFFLPFGSSDADLHNGFPIMGGIEFKILGFSYSGAVGGSSDVYSDGTKLVFELMENGLSISTNSTYLVIDFSESQYATTPRIRYSNYLSRPLDKLSIPTGASVDDGTAVQPTLGTTDISEPLTLSICFREIYDGDDVSMTTGTDMDFNRHKISLWCVTTNNIQSLE
jgi:hypothetical protein